MTTCVVCVDCLFLGLCVALDIHVMLLALYGHDSGRPSSQTVYARPSWQGESNKLVSARVRAILERGRHCQCCAAYSRDGINMRRMDLMHALSHPHRPWPEGFGWNGHAKAWNEQLALTAAHLGKHATALELQWGGRQVEPSLGT